MINFGKKRVFSKIVGQILKYIFFKLGYINFDVNCLFWGVIIGCGVLRSLCIGLRREYS